MEPGIKIYVICSVREASDDDREKLEAYIKVLEGLKCKIHLPRHSVNEEDSQLGICVENCTSIQESDEVHIFYDPDSPRSHFDMGIAFAFNKPIVVVKNTECGEGKPFPKMLDEWKQVWI